MKNIETGLIVLGMSFILFGIFDYIKLFKKLKHFYKITKSSKKTNICILLFMILFIILYSLTLKTILTGKIENNRFSLIISALLFAGGSFVYVVIILLKKTFFSIESFHIETVKSLVKIVELRDKYTKGHSEDVASLTELIFNNLPPNLKVNVSKNDLIQAALLHDIGKILVPENILNKKGALTNQEYKTIKKHTDDGCRILGAFELFQKLSPWVKYHHERIDGFGYHGLKKDDIPFESKIIAVADTYSALTTNRTYRDKIQPDKAIEVLKSVAGTQLDNDIVEVLVKTLEKKLNNSLESSYSPHTDRVYEISMETNFALKNNKNKISIE